MRSAFRQRPLILALLIALVIPAFALALQNPPRALAASCAEDANNLLKNGTMAGGAPNTYGIVAKKWKAFVVGATQPHFENAGNEGYDPNGSQYIWRDFDAWDAGIYQKLTTLTSGQTYHFWMVWGQALHDIAGNNARATLINRQIGIDVTGGADPTSPNVQWTIPYYGGGGFNRAEWHLHFTASTSTATFFLRAQNGHLDGRNKVFFDTACLYPASGSPTSTPWTPTLTPTPLPNSIEDTDANILYSSGWKTANDANATNNTFHYARGKKGAGISFQYNFTGTQITVRYIGLTNRGKAKVFIDGVKVGVMDQYAPNLTYNLSQTFSNLSTGAHVLKIKNAGAKNLNATDSFIILDALQFSTETAASSFQKNITQRVTTTPAPKKKRGAPTPTPVLPPPQPFDFANPAAPTPDDPSVIWDPRLPEMNVSLEPANISAGTLYWKLIRADYQDGTQSGGNHNMYYIVTNEQGAPVANQKVWQSWPDDSTSAQTRADGTADIAMWANYWPLQGPGPYNGYVGGLPSDVVRGMGLPGNHHVNFILYFQKTVKSGNGSPTDTPTPTHTLTSTTTPPPTATHPYTATATQPAPPSPTTPPNEIYVDDAKRAIKYKGAWKKGKDSNAFDETYHYGRGVKGQPVILQYNFTGTAIKIWCISFRNRGKAKVWIDGVKVGVMDQYTPNLTYYRAQTYGNLSPGPHTITIKNGGAKNASSSDSYITLDALIVTQP